MRTQHAPTGLALICAICLAPQAMAWGPHPVITKAALQVLPEAEQAREVLGAEFDQLTNYAWMPDTRGQDFATYYPDDYLLIRAFPTHAGHGMPLVAQTYEPYFRRALQALRTETPANACRQLGALIHFVEDSGAPPHAKLVPNLHGPMENWVKAGEIDIEGYEPQLLGADDASALAALKARMEQLVAFSVIRCDKAYPLVEQGETEREQVEPILLESALECARVTADLLHTVFTLALTPTDGAARLQGTVTAAEFHVNNPKRNQKGARVVLLDDGKYTALAAGETGAPALWPAVTDYNTLAASDAEMPAGGWKGTYAFRALPPGTYRVLAYRTGSKWSVSGPVTLEAGKTATMDVALAPSDPPGNIIQNPDGSLAYLSEVPDRWLRSGSNRWVSCLAGVDPGTTYRCGAVLKDPAAKVSFRFAKIVGGEPKVLELPSGAAGQQETTFACEETGLSVTVTVETALPLSDAVANVWVVPQAQ